MNIRSELKNRFREPLSKMADNADELLEMVRQSQDAKFGDYQANFAMSLGKRLARPPREVAVEIVDAVDVSDFCQPPEIAGPGFINLRIRNDWLVEQLTAAVNDPRLGVAATPRPRRFVIDYSAPNVAKPMHVGHIRSTVIGDSLCRVLRFLGHDVISDNHIGDWGTQFGMIIYGYRHFLDATAYAKAPVAELARLYRLVRQLVDYHAGRAKLPELAEKVADQKTFVEAQQAAVSEDEKTAKASGKKPDKKIAKALRKAENDLRSAQDVLDKLKYKLSAVEDDPELAGMAAAHEDIGRATLLETAKLHAGDADNLRLWNEFLPNCQDEINRVYARLGISFDHTLGESYYNDRLPATVDDLIQRGIARESDGAICVFLEGHKVPMLVRKQDGAFLYATTDLATIEYRMENWQPDAILYVVDLTARATTSISYSPPPNCWATINSNSATSSFGTVLGDDGRPFKTREGDTVGLESLLDEAVARASKIVEQNDDAKPDGPELSPQQRAQIADRVGIAALKYADLSQNRESDYVFSYDKMLAMNGNTPPPTCNMPTPACAASSRVATWTSRPCGHPAPKSRSTRPPNGPWAWPCFASARPWTLS